MTGAKALRVLVVFFTPVPDRRSGIATYALSLLAALVRRGTMRVSLLTNWSEHALPPALRDGGADYIYRKIPASGLLILLTNILSVRAAARAVGADIVFTPQHIGAILGGAVRILALHDLYIETHPQFFSRLERMVWAVAFRLAGARSDRIVCGAEATRRILAENHPRLAGKAAVVHYAPAITPALATGAGTPPNGPYGLIVAYATPFKNMSCLFAALDLLRRKGLAPPVYWVGRDETGEISACRDRYPEVSNVIALGEVDDAALASLYAGARFYLAPSLTEGFCLPVVEAQSFGAPVLCSDIPVLREVAGAGALAFDPARPAELAAAIGRLLQDDPLRASLSALAFVNAARFSWDQAAAAMEGLFRDCLAARAGGSGAVEKRARPSPRRPAVTARPDSPDHEEQ
jgi:glycosyltransferase involved in cell wall biosynthesis